MNYWKVIIATVVIFGAGVVTGGLLVNYANISHSHANQQRRLAALNNSNTNAAANAVVPPATNASSQRLPEVLARPFLPRLDNLLLLSSDQHKAIEKILADGQTQIRKVTQDTRMSIRAVLTPEQRSRFDELMKRPKRAAAVATNSPDGLPPAHPSVPVPTNPPATN